MSKSTSCFLGSISQIAGNLFNSESSADWTCSINSIFAKSVPSSAVISADKGL